MSVFNIKSCAILMAALGACTLISCQTQSAEKNEILPSVQEAQSEVIADVPPPKPAEPDLSLGPQPTPKPVAPVAGRTIPNAGLSLDGTGETLVAAEQRFPETGVLQGVTRAHTTLLQENGARGLEWSSKLESRAKLQAVQSEGMCYMQPETVLSAPGEAIYIAPAGKSSQGDAREVTVSVRRFVERLRDNKSGPFGKHDRGALHLGCAVKPCDNKQQVWLCRYS